MKNDNRNLRYIMYCRKSTDSEDRQIQSIEDQKRELDILINREKLNIVKFFGESQSAKKPGRLLYSQMMNMIKMGDADAIICWKLNRLARNPIDGGEIQWMIQNNIIKSIITPNREYLPQDNVIMMAVEFGMANQFILDLSKDVKRGMQTKVNKGWRPMRAPIGYINDKYGEKGNKKIFKDEDRFDICRKCWELLLSGNYTIREIRDISIKEFGLTDKKGKDPSVQTFYKMFKNTFYYGEYLYKGEWVYGKQERMITEEEFDLAQTILGKRGTPRPKYKRLPFNGLIRCGECGSMISCYEKIKISKETGEVKKYIYHKCSKSNKNIKCNEKQLNYNDIKEQFINLIDTITIPEVILKWAIETLRKENNLEIVSRDKILNNLNEKYQGYLKRTDNLIKLYTSEDNINKELLSDDEYKSQKVYLSNGKLEIEEQLERVKNNIDDTVEKAEKVFNFITYIKQNFNEAGYTEKTKILQTIGQSFTVKNGKIQCQLKPVYFKIQEKLNSKALKTAKSELMNLSEDKQKISLNTADFSIWSG